VFTRATNTWSQQIKLTANDGTAGSYFGVSVAINNSNIVIGSSRAVVNGVIKGAAYIFSKVAELWTFQKKLLTDYEGAEGYFGVSVTVSGEVVVVGASQETYGSFIKTGVVHIFKKINNSWVHLGTEMPLTRKENMHFGIHVILRNNTLVVTAQNENVGDFIEQGSIYVYKWNTNNYFNLLKRITDPNGSVGDQFGTSAAFDGSTYIAGAPYAQRLAGSSGAGVVFFGGVE
jgi:hypothetical protein